MNEKFCSQIIGTGSALPQRAVPNEELEAFLDTSHEWIHSRVGVDQRYVCAEGETTLSLSTEASRKAIEASGLKADDIDLVIVATVTSDEPLPSCAARLQSELGIKRALSFDIQAACSGFIFGMVTADSLLQSLDKQRALIVGAEQLSRIIDWSDRSTAVLFGDGAGAVVIERKTESSESGLIAASLNTDSSGVEFIKRTGGAFAPATFPVDKEKEDFAQRYPYVQMNGREVFRFGVHAMSRSAEEVLEQGSLSVSDLKFFIPHQANIRMISAVAERLGLDQEKQLAVNLPKVGNTSAASVGIALDEYVRRGDIAKGDPLLFSAVGSGMTFGSLLLRY